MAPDDETPRYTSYRGGARGASDPIDARARARARGDDLNDPTLRDDVVVLPGDRDAPPTPRRAPGPPRAPQVPRRRRRGRAVVVALSALALAFALWVGYGYLRFSTSIDEANRRVDSATRTQLSSGGSILSSATTILLLGADKRPKESAGGRSDSIMLVRSDPGRNRIVLLSIPRDLRVPVPGHSDDRINSAYAIGGPALALQTVHELTQLPINHVMVVDFAGFRSLIDTLGGITVNNPEKIVSNSFDGVQWRFSKGRIQLDGRHALAYSRVRENTLNSADTDVTRGGRQQAVLAGLKARLASPSTLFDLPTVGTALGRPLTTDLSGFDLLSLGWRAARGSTLRCHFGGTITSIGGASELLSDSAGNRQVLSTFIGRSAPQRAAAGSPLAPGCG